MASTINTNIVKLRTSSNGCLPFKANDHENNHMRGYQGWEDLEWWTCAKGKRKLWLRGTDDVLVVGLHMVGKRVKVSSLNNVTSFLVLLFFFHLIHPSHIFLATPLLSFFFFFQSLFHSLIHIFLFLFLFIFLFFLSFFSIHILFSLFFPLLTSFSPFPKLSTPLFLACTQSEF
jgi:hypothetical protein